MIDLIIMGANSPDIIRCIETINQSSPTKKINVLGFIDNDISKHGKNFLGRYSVLGAPNILDDKNFKDCFVINNITRDCATRKETTLQIQKYTNKFTSIVHPSINTDDVLIEEGVIALEGCVLCPRSKILKHAALSLSVVIGHDSEIGEFSFIGPSSQICGETKLSKEVYVGAGSIICPKLTIGENTMIGAGSLIAKNINANSFTLATQSRVMGRI